MCYMQHDGVSRNHSFLWQDFFSKFACYFIRFHSLWWQIFLTLQCFIYL